MFKTLLKPLVLVITTSLSYSFVSFADTGLWKYENNSWKYYDNTNKAHISWLNLGNDWYYFDTNSNMHLSWLNLNNSWYFFNPISGKEQGKMLKSWQWIDGYCYFFDTKSGKMYSNTKTPDGFFVNSEGKWINENGLAIFKPNLGISGKNILNNAKNTKEVKNINFTNAKSKGGGGGSGFGGNRTISEKLDQGKPTHNEYDKTPTFTNAKSEKTIDKTILNNNKADTDTINEVNVDKPNLDEIKDKSNLNKPISDTKADNESGINKPILNDNTDLNKFNSHDNNKSEVTTNKPNLDNAGEKNTPKKNIPSDSIENSPTSNIKDELNSKDNNNISTYIDENGEEQTIIWVKGIIPPKMGDSGDFTKDITNVSGQHYEFYKTAFIPNKAWYDTNKAKIGENTDIDRNLCFAATATNMLQWWLEQNKDKIENYIQTHGDIERKVGKKTYKISEFINNFPSDQENSLVFDYYKDMFGYNEKGFFSDLLLDLFINGYTPKKHGGVNHKDDFKIDNRGAFFHDIFNTELLTDRTYAGNYEDLSSRLKDFIGDNKIVGVSHTVFNSYNHIVTLWGAEYNSRGKLVAIYVTDSDDQNNDDIAMKRYLIRNVNGKAKISTNLSNKNAGSNVGNLYTLSLGENSF